MRPEGALLTAAVGFLVACSTSAPVEGRAPLLAYDERRVSYKDMQALVAVQQDFVAYFEQQRQRLPGTWLDQFLAEPRNYSVLLYAAEARYGNATEVVLLPHSHPDPNKEFRGGGLQCVVAEPAYTRLFCVRMK